MVPFEELIFELTHIFTLPHHLPLVHLTPTGQPISSDSNGDFDASDSIPLLQIEEMPGEYGIDDGLPESSGFRGPRDHRRNGAKNAKDRVEQLGELIDRDSLPGGKTFAELSLYEKKSVLIERELECVVSFIVCSG